MSIFGRKEIAALKAELAEKEQELSRVKELLADLNSKAERKNSESNDEYYCNTFRDRIIKNKKSAASIYVRKYNFLSPSEHKLYKHLCEISSSDKLKKYKLTVFAQVRLADIVNLWENTFENFKSHISYPSNDGVKTNHHKEKVYSEMENAGFNDKKYNQTFLYPLLRSHIDFLICRPMNNALTPLMAIELFGEEHFDSKNIKRQSNDEFKKFLFEAVGVGFDNSLTNEAIKEASKNEEKLSALKTELEGKILGARDDNERIAKIANDYNEVNYN